MEEDDIYTKDGTVDYRGNPDEKKKTGTWRACPFIIGNEGCERLAYSGMSTNLVLYFKHRLNQRTWVAATNNQIWGGTCYITPLIACFSIIYIIGMTLLALSAFVHGMRPRCSADDNCNPTDTQSAMAFLALYLIALGTGGIKPCVSSYGADQFDDKDEKEKKHNSSFFNWFYLSINIGALIAASVLVLAASIRKFEVAVPADKSLLHETGDKESNIKGSRKIDHTNDLSFFDKVAVEIETDRLKGSGNPWRLCTVTQVEELKAIIRLLPLWASGIIFSTVYIQMGTLFVLQGERMDTRVGHSNFHIPPASLSIFDTLSVIFWVPIYDRIIVPVMRKFTGHKNGLTQLQRMGIGLFISIFPMVVAAILEHERLQMIKKHNYYELKEMPMTIFWQVPQYFLIGCTEVFTFIGQLEFFYDQAPDAMRSFCSASSLATGALGSYLSSLLVTIVSNVTAKDGKPGWIPDNLNHGHIDYFFWLLAALSVLNLGVYAWIAKWYTYKRAAGTLR
ncbi:NRT1/ PTR family 8.1, ARABIDOPSIS THALIANA PEPTIDE TRANSPORTER 1, peptide transporter 1 [Hibiscus trionum]|uniref:NRT1/ PTR family 8.1, ARABIDOPSIS THALIANA PEPTIDE TRANSPORTER 1, peptide transporter 1 n=1 Tax=Hibiscus trionum TaxID=183268 RepID=A0A9W7LYJ4_HIBTR|nr:NRT1/ PTR family 8.1, ARABIDOPSIS THALIANA PEPTIDE TRANSPORTER 1, peptide transporter 1 [Hibiscus trionum]